STGAEVLQLKGHEGTVYSVAVTRDGTRIVTGSDDNTARIWDTETGAEILQLKGHEGTVNGVAVTPDGTRIVTGSDDNTARVWDIDTGAELLQLKGNTEPITGVAVTPDGTRIVTGSQDKTVRVWTLARFYNLAYAQKIVPRCLSIEERRDFLLHPQPQDWCIEMAKYPYDTPAWRAKGAIADKEIATMFGNFSDGALYRGDFPNALKAADLG